MFDFATAWLLQNKVLLPAASTLTRVIGEIRERATRRLWRKLAALPNRWQTAQLAGLLEIPEGQRLSVMEHLKEALSLSAAPRSLKHLNVTLACAAGVFLSEFHWAARHTAPQSGTLCRNGIGEIYQQNARRTAAGDPYRIRESARNLGAGRGR